MKRRIRLLSVLLLGIVDLLVATPKLWAIPLSQKKIIIEVNATAGDGGIQISVDATGWNRLEVFDPDGMKVFDVTGGGSVGMTGVTELFFESAEPSFEDLPLDQLLARFTAGDYTFRGTTVDGKLLSGKAALKHNIPAGLTVRSPAEGATLDAGAPVVIEWDPVTSPFPGTILPVTIAGYQVIVERVKPQPLLAFSVFLRAEATRVTVPAEFIEANADYKFEVLAIEASGNQTITEGEFSTVAPKPGLTDGRALGAEDQRPRSQQTSAGEASGMPRVAYLRPNHPNPFRPATAFEFGLAGAGVATLSVIDVRGRVVRTLVNAQLPAGRHKAAWDGKDGSGNPVASGVYFAVFTAPGVSESRKVILAR